MLALTHSILSTSSPLLAYVGPGIGAGAIAVVLGVIGSIFLALFAIIWYPVKRLLKRKKKNTTATQDSTSPAASTTSSTEPESESSTSVPANPASETSTDGTAS